MFSLSIAHFPTGPRSRTIDYTEFSKAVNKYKMNKTVPHSALREQKELKAALVRLAQAVQVTVATASRHQPIVE